MGLIFFRMAEKQISLWLKEKQIGIGVLFHCLQNDEANDVV